MNLSLTKSSQTFNECFKRRVKEEDKIETDFEELSKSEWQTLFGKSVLEMWDISQINLCKKTYPLTYKVL